MYTRDERKRMMDNIRFGHYDIITGKGVGQMTLACVNDARDANIIHYAVSMCAPGDTFNKKFGRNTCIRRINYLFHEFQGFSKAHKHDIKRDCLKKCLIGSIDVGDRKEVFNVFPDDICVEVVNKIAYEDCSSKDYGIKKDVCWTCDWKTIITRRNPGSPRFHNFNRAFMEMNND